MDNGVTQLDLLQIISNYSTIDKIAHWLVLMQTALNTYKQALEENANEHELIKHNIRSKINVLEYDIKLFSTLFANELDANT